MTRGKAEKTTEKREEQAFIAGRTGTLHHNLQLKGGRGESSMVPSERTSKSPHWVRLEGGRDPRIQDRSTDLLVAEAMSHALEST
jgi:hypothetical protein